MQGARARRKSDFPRTGLRSSESTQLSRESVQHIARRIVSALSTGRIVTRDEEAGGRGGHHDVPDVRRPGTRARVLGGAFVDLDSQGFERGSESDQARRFVFALLPLDETLLVLGSTTQEHGASPPQAAGERSITTDADEPAALLHDRCPPCCAPRSAYQPLERGVLPRGSLGHSVRLASMKPPASFSASACPTRSKTSTAPSLGRSLE